jgi:hypothetical protein
LFLYESFFCIAAWKIVNECDSIHIQTVQYFINYTNSLFSEVFKAMVKKTETFVTLKKIPVDDETLGVSGSLQ